jgi:hypothetical protein
MRILSPLSASCRPALAIAAFPLHTPGHRSILPPETRMSCITRPFPISRRRLGATLLAGPVSALSLALSLSLAAAPAWAQRITGSGQSVTEERPLPAFQGVASRGSFDITVLQGAASQVVVQADDNLLEYLETAVESGRNGPVLQVRWRSGTSINTRSKVRVTVTTPTLSTLAGAGSGDFRVGAFQTPSLRLSLSGSGDAQFDNLQTEDLSISLAGSSDVRGAGSARKLAVSVSGSGDVNLIDMRAEEVSVRIAGSGDVKVQAARTLEVSVAGSGDVTYVGDATVNSRIAGSGRIRKQ